MHMVTTSVQRETIKVETQRMGSALIFLAKIQRTDMKSWASISLII